MKRLGTLVLAAALAAAAIQGCSIEPALYLGGPPGPATQQTISNSNLTVIIGDSTLVAARAEDAVGNRTADAVTLSSCNTGIAGVGSQGSNEEWTTTAFVKGVAMGSACVLAQTAGMTDTIRVTVGPAGVKIVGDPEVFYDKQDAASNIFAFSPASYDGAGSSITGTVPFVWSTSDTTRFRVDPATGSVTTRAFGIADLHLSAPGGANDKVTLYLQAPAFQGSFTPTSGNQGTLVTMTRAAGGPVFDANTTAWFNFGTVRTYVESVSDDQLVVVVPAIGTAGRTDIVMSNIGPSDVDRGVPWTSPTTSLRDRYSPGNSTEAGAPEFSTVRTANNNVYIAHGGYGTGSGARGVWNGGTRADHLFKITVGAAPDTVSVTASWWDGSDLDTGLCRSGLSSCPGVGGSGSTTGESMSNVVLAANTTYYLVISCYNAGSNNTNIKVHVTGLP